MTPLIVLVVGVCAFAIGYAAADSQRRRTWCDGCDTPLFRDAAHPRLCTLNGLAMIGLFCDKCSRVPTGEGQSNG